MEHYPDKKQRKKFLYISLFVNLGLLFVFKYFNFFNSAVEEIYSIFTVKDYPINSLNILLPMGISFYTFQTLSYTIDVYNGKRKAERHLGYFALYVTYFPQLVAGPIERSERLLPQLKKKQVFDYNRTMQALLRMAWGFFKKIVIADRVGVLVNTVYGDVSAYTGIHLIIATFFFAIQIYCDFSAYSDIAIGTANIMGHELMENFKMPYFSQSIGEFWSRWHISLSTWFKDYLYIPLGGNRVSHKWKYYRNLLIVFLVSGLWHGANWTFIVWGTLHGVYSIVERILYHIKNKYKKLCFINIPAEIKTLVTFILVLFGWVFFRANNIGDAMYVMKNMNFQNISAVFNGSCYELGLDKQDFIVAIIAIIYLTIVDGYKYYAKKDIIITNDFRQGLCAICLVMVIVIFGFYGYYNASDFIYFQF
jgi:D-alanyl-lipoteichoic acid acyltransferase DltB (MBOAT superfamily)